MFPGPVPTTASADPTCVPTPAVTPTPSVTPTQTAHTPKTCSGCNADPDCPKQWPDTFHNEPIMVPLPTATPSDGTQLEWRVYPPYWVLSSAAVSPTPTPAIHKPIVLMIHGGSWSSGSPFQPDVERVSQAIADDGFYVFAASYRLASCGKITKQPAHDGSSASQASGRPPEQTDDIVSIIQTARADSRGTGKVGIVGVSSGGFISAYVALNYMGSADRPDCLVTFSSPFDISDLDLTNDPANNPPYIPSVQNYTKSFNSAYQRSVSPIAFVDSGTASHFKPMFIVQAEEDDTCPNRQLRNIAAALQNCSPPVDACDYVLTYIPVTYTNDDGGHGLVLWPQDDPNHPGQTIGRSALDFLHQYLD
jgi:acetyl esterase/lipase